jgi:hypothetical protein
VVLVAHFLVKSFSKFSKTPAAAASATPTATTTPAVTHYY